MTYTAAVITVSDKGARGEREDTSGPNLCRILAEHGFDVVHTAIVPDDTEQIQSQLLYCSDERHIALVLTTGGTGFSPRPPSLNGQPQASPRPCAPNPCASPRKAASPGKPLASAAAPSSSTCPAAKKPPRKTSSPSSTPSPTASTCSIRKAPPIAGAEQI